MSLARDVTVLVKHTPGFASRTRKLTALLSSIRKFHGPALAIIVATEGDDTAAALLQHQYLQRDGLASNIIVLPRGSGLSAGRNALIHAAQTPFVALMDDDLLLLDNASLPMLHDVLQANPAAAVAGGCHEDLKRGSRDCFNMRFSHNDDGTIVTLRDARVPHDAAAARVHVTHNFFIGRAATLRKLGWDPRQRVMEHETFFYQLYLNAVHVLACPRAIAAHDTRASKDDAYEMKSLRATEGTKGRDPGNMYLQHLCKNLPNIRRFHTPFTSWHCDGHEFCTPLWDAQFAFDGRHCASFGWDVNDDMSTVVRPLLAPHDSLDGRRDDDSSSGQARETLSHGRAARTAVPLLAIVLTQRANVARRAWQRSTWLSFGWHALHHRDRHGIRAAGDGSERVPWRYVYVERMASADGLSHRALNASDVPTAGELRGDVVALSATDRRSMLVAGVRWALARVDFEALLVTDDRSLVHVGRVWEWLLTRAVEANHRVLVWRRPMNEARGGESADADGRSATVEQLVTTSGSWLAGRAVCRQLLVGLGRKGRASSRERLVAEWVASPPGFVRYKAGGVSGATVVDGVRHRPHEAFRMLLRATGFPAVWQNPRAFEQEECAGCEARFFAKE